MGGLLSSLLQIASGVFAQHLEQTLSFRGVLQLVQFSLVFHEPGGLLTVQHISKIGHMTPSCLFTSVYAPKERW